jgi:predicted nucleic acid-binding protein
VILVDANVLIALVDPRQTLHPAATADLKKLPGADLLVAAPVLSEVCHLLPAAHHRARIWELIGALHLRPPAIPNDVHVWNEVFDWLARYAEHEPDWADAYLAVLCGRDKRLKVWTYDSEFRTVWRRPDGSRIPLAGKATPRGSSSDLPVAP